MATLKFNSNAIRVYPITIKQGNNTIGRKLKYGYVDRIATFEPNLVLKQQSIGDYPSYVISGLNGEMETKNKFTLSRGKCILRGYHIEILNGITISIPQLSPQNVYWVYMDLTLQDASTTYDSVGFSWKELTASDTQGSYTGVIIDIKDTEEMGELFNSNILILGCIITVEDTPIYISYPSNLKFNSDNISITLSTDSGLLLPFMNVEDIGEQNSTPITTYTTNLTNYLVELNILDDGEFSSESN